MSIVPPSGGGGQENSYQRRQARGTSRSIRWNKLTNDQVDAIRNYFTRNQWRRVVNAIIDNNYHWWTTHETQAEYDYKYAIANALGWTHERWDDFEDEHGDAIESLGWYHPPAGYNPGLA